MVMPVYAPELDQAQPSPRSEISPWEVALWCTLAVGASRFTHFSYTVGSQVLGTPVQPLSLGWSVLGALLAGGLTVWLGGLRAFVLSLWVFGLGFLVFGIGLGGTAYLDLVSGGMIATSVLVLVAGGLGDTGLRARAGVMCWVGLGVNLGSFLAPLAYSELRKRAAPDALRWLLVGGAVVGVAAACALWLRMPRVETTPPALEEAEGEPKRRSSAVLGLVAWVLVVGLDPLVSMFTGGTAHRLLSTATSQAQAASRMLLISSTTLATMCLGGVFGLMLLIGRGPMWSLSRGLASSCGLYALSVGLAQAGQPTAAIIGASLAFVPEVVLLGVVSVQLLHRLPTRALGAVAALLYCVPKLYWWLLVAVPIPRVLSSAALAGLAALGLASVALWLFGPRVDRRMGW